MDKFMNETETTLMLKSVYEHLQDDETRKIYAARSLFSLSDDKAYMADVVKNMTISRILLEQIEKHYDQKLILFGAGTWGEAITYFFPNINWNYVVDNNKAGKEINGYKIVTLDDVRDLDDCYVILAVLFKYREVEQQLLEVGVDKKNLLVLGRIAEERQYFDLPYLQFGEHEVTNCSH